MEQIKFKRSMMLGEEHESSQKGNRGISFPFVSFPSAFWPIEGRDHLMIYASAFISTCSGSQPTTTDRCPPEASTVPCRDSWIGFARSFTAFDRRKSPIRIHLKKPNRMLFPWFTLSIAKLSRCNVDTRSDETPRLQAS